MSPTLTAETFYPTVFVFSVTIATVAITPCIVLVSISISFFHFPMVKGCQMWFAVVDSELPSATVWFILSDLWCHLPFQLNQSHLRLPPWVCPPAQTEIYRPLSWAEGTLPFSCHTVAHRITQLFTKSMRDDLLSAFELSCTQHISVFLLKFIQHPLQLSYIYWFLHPFSLLQFLKILHQNIKWCDGAIHEL